MPHLTIAMTNGQEIRHIFLKNDLDHTVAGSQGGRSGGFGTFNSHDIVISTKELIDIVAGISSGKITLVHGIQLLRVSGDRNFKTIDAEHF